MQQLAEFQSSHGSEGSHAGEDAETRKKRREEKMRDMKKRLADAGAVSEVERLQRPRYRWRMEGADMKALDESLVLKGKALLRAFFVYPIMFCQGLKTLARRTKEENIKECKMALSNFHDSATPWLVRVLKVPIGSILVDRELNFDMRPFADPRRQQLNRNFVQMNVRVKAIVESLVASEPPLQLIKCLYKLMLDKGHKNSHRTYFPDDFLFQCEIRDLKTQGYGASKDVFELTDVHTFPVPPPKRVVVLLVTLLLVRVLVGNVLVAPWKHGLGKKAASKARRDAIKKNLKVVASIILRILRKIVPDLESLGTHKIVDDDEDEEGGGGPGGGSGGGGIWDTFTALLSSPGGGADMSDAASSHAARDNAQIDDDDQLHRSLFPTEHELRDSVYYDEWFSRVTKKLSDNIDEYAKGLKEWIDKTANLLVAERERSPDPLEYDPTTIMEQELAFDGDLISYVLMVADVDTYKAAAMAAIASAKKKKDEPKSPPAEAEAGAAAGSPSPEGRS